MRSSALQLHRFLRRVYARLLMMRVLESAGVGLLIAAGLGLLMLPVILIREQSPIGPSLMLLLIGAAGGAAFASLRAPKLTDAAAEADRQLNLADLLSTALSLERSAKTDPMFAGAVIGLAEAKCGMTAPSAVILHRLGVRSWGGIGLAGALLLTLSMIAANPLNTRADSTGLAGAGSDPSRLDGSNRNRAASMRGSSGRVSVAGVDHPNAEERTLNSANDPAVNATNATFNASKGQSAGDSQKNGAGTGAGRSNTTQPGQLETISSANTTRPSTGVGPTVTGTGAPGEGGRAGHTGGARIGSRDAAVVAPWASESWPGARSAAMEAVKSGRVPAGAADLVREYFDAAR